MQLGEVVLGDKTGHIGGSAPRGARDEHEFLTLEEAQEIIEACRVDYNTARPHGSLGNKTPQEFVLGLVNQSLPPLSAP